MPPRRLLKLKHERTDPGFLSASLSEDGGRDAGWTLRVESPSSFEAFHDHLADGSSMALSMVVRDGEQLRGEAYVSSISDGVHTATVVVLTGAGPLRRA